MENKVGERIYQRRMELNLTLENIADEIGVKRSTVQRYEKGKIAKMKLPVIEAIARVLRVNPAWLCGKTDDMEIPNGASETQPRNGTGPMKEEKPRDVALAEELEKLLTAGSDDFRKRLIAVLVNMPPERWKALEEIALDLLKSAPAPDDPGGK